MWGQLSSCLVPWEAAESGGHSFGVMLPFATEFGPAACPGRSRKGKASGLSGQIRASGL